MRDELQEFIILRLTSDELDVQEFTKFRQNIHERYNDLFKTLTDHLLYLREIFQRL
jgi:hypothetical protein